MQVMGGRPARLGAGPASAAAEWYGVEIRPGTDHCPLRTTGQWKTWRHPSTASKAVSAACS